jgi:hypothetical protein
MATSAAVPPCVIELQNAPSRLYRDPRTAATCSTFSAHCYFDAIHHDEKLVANFFDLDRGLFHHFELAAFRIFLARSVRRLVGPVPVRHG